jgi:hypothetical protein
MANNFLAKVKCKVVSVFKRKLTGKDIIRNIQELEEARSQLSKGTDEYNAIQAEISKEYDILKKYREGRFGIKPEATITAIAIFGMFLFAIALDRESPKPVKIAQFLIKLVRFGG